jgi:HSP20 family protein
MSRQEVAQNSGKANIPARASGLHAFADNIWEPLSRFRSEFDRIFDDLPVRTLPAGITRRIQSFSGPALEFKDRENEYELIAEVPGMKAEDIDLKVTEGVLRLSGERKDEREGKENGFLFSERHYGHFERAIQLPAGVDESKITAKAHNGLLSIHLPKSKESIERERKIPISA